MFNIPEVSLYRTIWNIIRTVFYINYRDKPGNKISKLFFFIVNVIGKFRMVNMGFKGIKNRISVVILLCVASMPIAHSSDLGTCQLQSSVSIQACKRLSDKGDPDGMFGLGMLLLEGKVVKRNSKKAFKLMYKAAMLGHAPAQFEVGQSYVNGQGVKKNYEEAFAWFLVAKENKSRIAQKGIDFLVQRNLVDKKRFNALTQKAIDLYSKTKNKKGYEYGEPGGSISVRGIKEYCETVMPTVNSIIMLRKNGHPRSDAQQMMVGMTDKRAIKMIKGVISWVWTSKTSFTNMGADFKQKCLNRSNEVRFIFP